MKFTLSSGAHFYTERSAIEEMWALGFTFELYERKPSGAMYDREGKRLPLPPIYMIRGEPDIEINTLEELLQFVKEHGQIVLREDTILIYNDYIE